MIIHETAIINPSSKIDDSVEIGPFCIVGEGVEINEGTKLLSHVVIKGPTSIGKNNTFQFMKSSAIIPNTLAISYALGIANSGKAKKIYIAGFDGYEAEDPKRREMDELFSLYQSLKSKAELTSITPTKYKVKSISVYAL